MWVLESTNAWKIAYHSGGDMTAPADFMKRTNAATPICAAGGNMCEDEHGLCAG